MTTAEAVRILGIQQTQRGRYRMPGGELSSKEYTLYLHNGKWYSEDGIKPLALRELINRKRGPICSSTTARLWAE